MLYGAIMILIWTEDGFLNGRKTEATLALVCVVGGAGDKGYRQKKEKRPTVYWHMASSILLPVITSARVASVFRPFKKPSSVHISIMIEPYSIFTMDIVLKKLSNP